MAHRFSRPIPTVSDVALLAGQVYQLYEDFSNKVVPYRQNSDAYDLSTAGVDSHVVERALTPDGRRIEDFIRSVTCSLLMDHEVWLEVAFDPATHGASPFQVFPVACVRRTGTGDLIQNLPERPEVPEPFRNDDAWGNPIRLDKDRMIHVTLPDSYPHKLLKGIFEELAEYHHPIAPQWTLEAMSGARSDAPSFDLEEYSRIGRLRLLQAALPIGWSGRVNFLSSESRELGHFYYYLRELQFLHFRASLRVRAEDALCKVLALAGMRCGFTFEVTANGIYNPDEIEGIIREFESGEISFSTMSDIVFEGGFSDKQLQKRVVC